MTTALEIDETLLDAFIGDGSITDVLYVVRSGKEATVYCCRGAASSNGDLVAAKVYRPLERRNFHNEAINRKAATPRSAAATNSRWRKSPVMGATFSMEPGSTRNF